MPVSCMSLGQEILVWSGDKRVSEGTPVEDENTDQKGVYLGRHYNARSLQLSLEELHHILVVVGISTEEAEEEGSQRKERKTGMV